MRFITFFLITFLFISPISYKSSTSTNLNFSTLFSLPDYVPVPSKTGLVLNGSSFLIKIKNLGDRAYFNVSYYLNPFTNNITFSVSSNHFYLDNGEEKIIYVTISVKPGTVGSFNLTIIVEGKINNVALGSSKRMIIECIKGNIYVVNVFTRMYDGTPIYARIVVDIKKQGTRYTIMETTGPHAKIHLLQGTYVFSAYLGSSKLDEKEVIIDSNDTVVNLEFSLIIIVGFEIKREPRYTTDPLIFSVTIKSISDLIGHRNLDIYVEFNGNSSNFTSYIGSIEIKGQHKVSLTSFIEPKNEWNNQTYTVKVIAKSKNISLANFVTSLKITVYSKNIIIANQNVPIIYFIISALSGVLGVLVGTRLNRRKVIKEVTEMKPIIKKVLIGGEGRILLIFDAIEKKFREDLLEDDRYNMALSIVESLITVSEKMGEGGIKSYSTRTSKYIINNLDGGFRIILEADISTNENDPQLLDKLSKLREFIAKKHAERGIKSPSQIISLIKYSKLLEDIKFII